MVCAQYRQALLSDPHADHQDLRRHLGSCAECARFTEQVLRFERRLERAMRLDLRADGRTAAEPAEPAAAKPAAQPADPAAPPQTRRPWRVRRGWLAAAASVLLAAVVAGGLWLAAPGPSLAADVVSHMAEEPGAWTPTQVPVPQPALDAVLGESQVRLKANAGLVTYANSCVFRGHRVPHLVLQTAAGPVTVMVLTHERPLTSVRFDEHGYRGIIVPVAGHGSIAVLERGTAADSGAVQRVAATVLAAIEWPP
jgi:hypothetical protein